MVFIQGDRWLFYDGLGIKGSKHKKRVVDFSLKEGASEWEKWRSIYCA
jgi:hypothetical protein